jgi:DNA-binding SARP family transcriptional activator
VTTRATIVLIVSVPSAGEAMADDRERRLHIHEAPDALVLGLTGEFHLFVADRPLAVPHTVERLLAFLALTGRTVSRTTLAGSLWLGPSEEKAANNLRTTLWRLRRAGAPLVTTYQDRVALSSAVSVDVAELSALSQRLAHAPSPQDFERLPLLFDCGELLPDWDEDWVVADRERFRLLRLQALESAACALMERRHLVGALLAALAASRADPLRESARRLVIQLHIREGNVAEALRSYEEFRRLLWLELRIEPSRLMERMVEPFDRGRDGRVALA